MNQSLNLQQFQIRKFATELFLKEGFDNVTMARIAQGLDIEEQELYLYYGGKSDIVLGLYQCINEDWQIAVGNLKPGRFHERFEEAMMLKIQLMDPYSDALAGMMGHLLRSDRVGVGAGRTAFIRRQGMATVRMLIEGSDDGAAMSKAVEGLPTIIYLLHWGLLLLHVQGGDIEQSRVSVGLATRILRKVKNASILLPFFPVVKDLGAWAQQLVGNTSEDDVAVSEAILRQIFHHRKLLSGEHECEKGICRTCLELHLPKVLQFVAAGKPIHFVLPAFPAKSPNPQKTIGELPDLGEEIALLALKGLCDEIGAIYPPGAHITICSDGRIFSELVEVSDVQISAYVAKLREFISESRIDNVELLNLEDLLPGLDFDAARRHVLEQYSEPIEELRERVKTNSTFAQLFNGIHRFIFEDRLVLHPENSATKTKELSKGIALSVIQHSNAWTRFLVQIYPEAIRLSIHPYEAHSDKIGIQLTKAADNWLTPWHGAIVLQEDGYALMKRKEAEAIGAKLIQKEGRNHHFTTVGK